MRKNKRKNRRRRTHKESVRDGKEAWRKTIRPSHDKCEKKLKHEYQNDHVTSTTGMPDFVIIWKNKAPQFTELKPCRLAKNQRASYQSMYLSLTQEQKISWLIKHGMYVSMIYYNKSGKRFQFSREVKLTSKNYKRFCFSTPWEKRIDPDDLFKP